MVGKKKKEKREGSAVRERMKKKAVEKENVEFLSLFLLLILPTRASSFSFLSCALADSCFESFCAGRERKTVTVRMIILKRARGNGESKTGVPGRKEKNASIGRFSLSLFLQEKKAQTKCCSLAAFRCFLRREMPFSCPTNHCRRITLHLSLQMYEKFES